MGWWQSGLVPEEHNKIGDRGRACENLDEESSLLGLEGGWKQRVTDLMREGARVQVQMRRSTRSSTSRAGGRIGKSGRWERTWARGDGAERKAGQAMCGSAQKRHAPAHPAQRPPHKSTHPTTRLPCPTTGSCNLRPLITTIHPSSETLHIHPPAHLTTRPSTSSDRSPPAMATHYHTYHATASHHLTSPTPPT